MRKKRDYYSVLQLNRSASNEAIEVAYTRLAGQYDPTTSKRPKAAQRLQEIQEAYDVLSDQGRRAEYDRQRPERGAGPLGSAVVLGPLLASFRRRPSLFGGITGLVLTTFVLVILWLAVLSGGDEETGAVATVPTATPSTSGSPPPSSSPAVGAPDAPPEVTGEEITTDSGLTYIDIVVGEGASPAPGETVRVHYTGWLESDGTKFDSSVDRGAPSEFVLGQLIDGWNEGLSTMQEGGKRRLIITSELGYGEADIPGIPPNSTLIFDVELLQVRQGPEGTP